MNEVVVFQNEKFGKVRTVEKDGGIWFVATDIAKALDFADATHMTRILDDDEKGLHNVETLGGVQNLSVINESGLYHAIMQSRKPEAASFRKWVTSEVLPSIRKTGGYVAPVASGKSDAEIRNEEKALKIESAKFLHELAAGYSDLPEYRQILDAYAVKEVVGEFALPLPEVKKNGMKAGEIGAKLGISKNRVGILANKYKLKTPEFGQWRLDKSPFSAKEVENFYYFDNAIDKFRECMELEAQEKAKVKEAS